MAKKKAKTKTKKKKRAKNPLVARDPRPQKKKEKVEDNFESEDFGAEELTGSTEDFEDGQLDLF